MKTPLSARLSVLLCGAAVVALLAPTDANAKRPSRRGYRGPSASPEPPDLEPEVVAPPPSAPPTEAPPSAGPAAPPSRPPVSGVAPDPPTESPPTAVAEPEPDPDPEPEPEPEAEPTEDDSSFSFDVVDLTEDEEALKQELAVETKRVRGPSGLVAGRVLDSTTGEPLIGAYVEVVDGPYKTKTDFEGKFELELPPGRYDIRVRSDANEPRRISNVVVAADDTQTINSELQPLAGAGQTVLVEAEMDRESEGARLLERKESAGTRDLMSRDEIAKAGGGSASAVARRIVGVTIVGGRYIFVRGLGHRYGNTLFDGARVPSPEPEIRTVPLDIFPASALSAINVQKTFTPDVPGDFAGGSVQLESRDVPDNFMYEVGANIGANTETTFRRMYTNGGFGAYDAFGFGNIPRGLSSQLPSSDPASRGVLDENFQPVYSPADIERFGDSMYTDTRIRRSAKAPPNFGLKGAIGYGFRPQDDSKFGVLVAAGYKNKHQTIRNAEPIRQFGIGEGGGLSASPQLEYSGMRTTYTVSWSTIGLAKYDINKRHRLELLGFYSREAEDETRYLEGIARNVSGIDPVINTRIRYITRGIAMTRLGGKHEFPKARGLQLDWFGSYANARRDDPAIREMFFTDANNDGEYLIDRGNEGGKQTFLSLEDHTESGALNLTLPFDQWKKLRSKVKVGAWVEGKQRNFQVRRFQFQQDAEALDQLPTGTGNIINDATIGSGEGDAPFFLQENTRPNDNYLARQEIYSGYGMLELPFVRWLKVVGGARVEASSIVVDPFDRFADDDDEAQAGAKLSGLDVLPAGSFIFSPNDKHNIRIGATGTLARPEFRELAPFTFTDFVGGVDVQGNPQLQGTRIWNGDLRWEWFPSSNEVIAVSGFYKYFDEPIERVKLPRIPQLASFRNADAAQNVGGELEVRKNLEFVWKKLRDVSIGANFAYIHSRVKLRDRCRVSEGQDCSADLLADVSTSRVRPLQDQSPYVVNVYVGYDNEDVGVGARVLYNVEGPRIYEVGGNGLPDVYFEPRHSLDFTFTQRLYRDLSMDFKVENMLNQARHWTQAGETVERWTPGATFTLGFSWTHERSANDDE